jgi:predicted nuclease of predicted toxin-antitoxin system
VKIKLDENIGRRGRDLLRRERHDVSTVHDQGLSGAPDETVFEACTREGRVLVTLDRDFGNVLRFKPRESSGVVILELGGAASLELLHDRLAAFVALAANRAVEGELWIVEPGRIRVHLERDGD